MPKSVRAGKLLLMRTRSPAWLRAADPTGSLRGTARRAAHDAPLSWLVAIAAAGTVVGHQLAYRISVPHEHHRESLLAETGHSYLPLLTAVVIVAGVWAVARHVVRSLRGATDRPREEITTRSLPRRLVVAQLAIFATMESSERLAAGEPLTSLFDHHHTFLIGLATQALVAMGLALLVCWLGRAAALLARFLAQAHAPRRASVARWCPPALAPATYPARSAWTIRGPPGDSLR